MLVRFHVQIQIEVQLKVLVWVTDCGTVPGAGQISGTDGGTEKIRCRNRLQQYLVLVLHSNKGPSIYKLLSDVNVSPEAGVVHCRVAVLIHKVHVRLVAEEQLDDLVEIIYSPHHFHEQWHDWRGLFCYF